MKKTLIIISLILTTAFAFGCETKDQPATDSDTASSKTPTEQPTTPSPTSSMKTTPETGDTIAVIKTNKGEIKVLLYTELAPITTTNFIELTNQEKYNDVIFHRVIKDFMLQTGDFEFGNGTGGYTLEGPSTKLEDEFGEGLEHLRGALSMANAGFPDSGASQFFIVQKEDGTSWLDGLHAVFGFVYEGMDIVDEIAVVEVAGADKPVEDVMMESVTISTF